MATREVKSEELLESLLEPATPTPTTYLPTTPKPHLPKLSLPHLNLDDKVNFEIVKYLVVRIVIISFLLWFGLTSTGSINGPAFGRFSGDLARVFYQWQFGNLLAMIGVVVAYDTVKRFI